MLRLLIPSKSSSLRLVSSSHVLKASRARLFSTAQEGKEKQNETEEKPKNGNEDHKEIIKKLEASVAEKDSMAKEYMDKYKRSLAEMENVRERNRRDVENAKNFGIQKFSKELLDVADILELALKSVSHEDLQTNKLLKALHEGIQMTEKEIHKVFEKNGLKVFDPMGEKFDPNLHEALFEIPDPTKPSGTIAAVQKKGYVLNTRTLRPAQVGVTKGGNANNSQ